METAILSIASALTVSAISGGFIVVIRQIKKVMKRIELADIKHDALVHALQSESKNGFLGYYNAYVESKLKDKEYINN